MPRRATGPEFAGDAAHLEILTDMTNASSVPMELQASIPELMVPVLPIVEAGKDVFSMFADLQRRYFWILQPVSYKNADELVQFIDEAIIGRAEKAAEAINTRRTESVLPPVQITGVMLKKR